MSEQFETLLRRYDYVLPQELIAQEPANPRDSSQFVMMNRATGERTCMHFRDIGNVLPKNAVLVLNETKVIPARLNLTRADGRNVEALILGPHADGRVRALARGNFPVGEILSATDERTFVVEGRNEKELLLHPSFPLQELSALLEQEGVPPLPPYIDHSSLSEAEIKERYQSVFAKNPGSIAAPTASLHFTSALMDLLTQNGVSFARVTLHVHLGTFSPLTEEHVASGQLHEESYCVDPATAALLEEAKRSGRPIIPVGTTALRTIESAFDEQGRCSTPEGTTRLFIREGYAFKMATGLITNFHVPKSSLLMLVCAFGGYENVMETYRQAMEKKFRFFSFGDAMGIW